MITFTKKHYKKIAEVMAMNYETGSYYESGADLFKEIYRNILNMFERDNPKFNKSKFYTAVYGDKG